MVTYPCPFCGAQADVDSGCSGCGRPPYPDAAEVVRLNARTTELYADVQAARAQLEEARSRYSDAVQRFNAVQAQRNLLAARVKQAVAAAEQPAQPAIQQATQAAIQAAIQQEPARQEPARVQAPSAPRPDAEPRTVQNALFILGGLLLGSAAIVFAAVAWASFGVIGRAAILATVTLITLAVPPVALARRLRATAETFAALGLLLVLLDGYAAWYVNLAGLAEATSRSTYAGLVCAVTAAVAGAYAAATRLRGPRFAALVAIQPVLPLLAVNHGFGATGWALVFVVLAALNLLLARTVEIVAWFTAGLAALAAGPLVFIAMITVEGVPGAARASATLLLLGAVIVAAGLAHRVTAHVGVGIAAGIVAIAGIKLSVELLPHQRYAAFAAVAAVIAAATLLLPQRVRRGGRIGALAVAGVTAAPYVIGALASAVGPVAQALPAWIAQPTLTVARFYDWQVPVALALLAGALAVLVRHRAVGYVAAVLLAFAAPGVADTPLAVVSIVDGAVLLALAATALWLDRWAVVAMSVVALHLVLVGLVTPLSTLLTFAGLIALSAMLALRTTHERLRRAASVVAVAAVPVLAAAAFRLSGFGTSRAADTPLPLAGAFAGLVLATVAAVALRKRLDTAGLLGVTVAGAGVSVAAVWVSAVDGGRTPFGVFAVAALLCAWLVASRPATSNSAPETSQPATGEAAPETNRPGTGDPVPETRRPATGGAAPVWHWSALPAAVPAVAALAAVVPSMLEILFRPYRWLTEVWQGAPSGVGLDPAGAHRWTGDATAFGPGPVAVTLALLAVLAILVARRARMPLWTFARTPVTFAAVLGCVAVDAPWPAVPAVTLAAGLATGLLAALRPTKVNIGAVTCWFTVGAGLAGCLATPAATLSALAAVLVVTAVIGVAGQQTGARAAGWLVASLAAGWLAFAAARTVDLPLRWCAYGVLLAAAVILAAAQLIRRRGAADRLEGRVLETVAHATAAVALLLTVGDLAATAGVCSLWGVALGLRALVTQPGPGLTTQPGPGLTTQPGPGLTTQPGPGQARAVFAGLGAAAQLVAYWLVLVTEEVAVPEAYTLPAGLLALAAGWLAARRNPTLTSWLAFAPGLLAGLVPSLATVLITDGGAMRRLLLGTVAVAVVVVGAVRRLQAPVIIGGSVLAVLAVHEIVVFWELPPRWVPLAIAGLLLVGLATTYERRRRDLTRLKSAVGRMR